VVTLGLIGVFGSELRDRSVKQRHGGSAMTATRHGFTAGRASAVLGPALGGAQVLSNSGLTTSIVFLMPSLPQSSPRRQTASWLCNRRSVSLVGQAAHPFATFGVALEAPGHAGRHPRPNGAPLGA
jgi:hypothetical protein